MILLFSQKRGVIGHLFLLILITCGLTVVMVKDIVTITTDTVITTAYDEQINQGVYAFILFICALYREKGTPVRSEHITVNKWPVGCKTMLINATISLENKRLSLLIQVDEGAGYTHERKFFLVKKKESQQYVLQEPFFETTL